MTNKLSGKTACKCTIDKRRWKEIVQKCFRRHLFEIWSVTGFTLFYNCHLYERSINWEFSRWEEPLFFMNWFPCWDRWQNYKVYPSKFEVSKKSTYLWDAVHLYFHHFLSNFVFSPYSEMIVNITELAPEVIIGAYIVVVIYTLSVITSIVISSMIIYTAYVTPQLHTPANILIINTCLCTLCFSSVSTLFTIFFFLQSALTDWTCRIQGYLYYVAICLLNYSLVIQTISRFFWTVLYKYRHLLTMKSHLYLILIQVLLSFLFPLSTLITKDIRFRPFQLCFIPEEYQIHNLYLLFVDYFIPSLIALILYIIIYRKTTISSLNSRRSAQGARRDRRLARNIVILLGISLFGGFPFCIVVLLSGHVQSLPLTFYLFAITTPAIAIIFEKFAIVLFNQEIRRAMKRLWNIYSINHQRLTRVIPVPSPNNTRGGTLPTIS